MIWFNDSKFWKKYLKNIVVHLKRTTIEDDLLIEIIKFNRIFNTYTINFKLHQFINYLNFELYLTFFLIRKKDGKSSLNKNFFSMIIRMTFRSLIKEN